MASGAWRHSSGGAGASSGPARGRRAGVIALRCLLGLAGATLLASVLAAAALLIMPSLPLEDTNAVSVTVLDRDDRLLRAYATSRGRWRLPIEPAAVDQRYQAMLLALEDKRFFSHPGVDPLAMLRATMQLVRSRHIVSGGSTLTMQLVRLIEGEHARSLGGKVHQALAALALERRLSKQEILALYMRLAPFGGNLEGVRAASLAYFGKEPRRLSPAQAALLVALPQAPELRRPDRFPAYALRARNRVLDRAVAAGVLSRSDAVLARAERMPSARRAFPMLAPHLADTELAREPQRIVHRLTIDGAAQARLQSLVAAHASLLPAGVSAALIAVDNDSGAVLAAVGSPGYLDQPRFGAVDMTGALRSPGSTLKPLIYGLAFERGLAHPETLIEDRPARFGLYVPKNFDADWHGTVSVRTALAQSLNIPAVKVLDALGPGRLYARLGEIGITPLLPKGEAPGLAIALGGLGLTLADLAAVYVGFARGGEPVVLHYRRDGEPPPAAPRTRLLTEVAAYYVTDILRHAPAPANAKGGEIAYKTGTSYGYRDAWAVGYDGRHTVAVWVGRPDAAATAGLTGRASAAPLLFDAFQRLALHRTPLRSAPAGALLAAGSELPPPLKRFREGRGDGAFTSGTPEARVLIAFPPDRCDIEVEDEDARLVVTAEGGNLPLTWLLDGEKIDSDPARRQAELPAGRHGFVRLSVIDAEGRADSVTVRLK
jgi:penicillin-binding protein 1C